MTSEVIGHLCTGPEVYCFQATEVGANPVAVGSYGVQRLNTDPVGVFTATFAGIALGASIHVYYPGSDPGLPDDDVLAASVEVSVENQTLAWNRYSVGSAQNNVKIVITKRGFRIMRFAFVTPSVSAQTIPIFPLVDLGYNNPA